MTTLENLLEEVETLKNNFKNINVEEYRKIIFQLQNFKVRSKLYQNYFDDTYNEVATADPFDMQHFNLPIDGAFYSSSFRILNEEALKIKTTIGPIPNEIPNYKPFSFAAEHAFAYQDRIFFFGGLFSDNTPVGLSYYEIGSGRLHPNILKNTPSLLYPGFALADTGSQAKYVVYSGRYANSDNYNTEMW
eukprot:CAMPEP_0117420474 /NCGR_PEP_ID=MMETSP0758-20121206/1800_1 /TAXON_ID=63605 /ORGANISM="Percolomonas cosmopolitus, Strain AE-1 (ATCC 50343)" /LENGTH=189 /DNA_ID=CAMNT_0005202103 /DNA_START=114 /DNA_END=680 /DNA_ORIENTATION=-